MSMAFSQVVHSQPAAGDVGAMLNGDVGTMLNGDVDTILNVGTMLDG